MKKTKYLLEMTWKEIEKAINNKSMLIFCVGSIEQHGFHLPLGVDTYLPMEISQRVAEKVNAVIAPPVNYGYKSLYRSGGGPNFPGSIGVTGTTLISLIKDIFTDFFRQGWRHILVLDWHLENIPFVYEGIDESLRLCDYKNDIKIVKIDNPNGLGIKYDPDLKTYLFGDDFPGWEVEHASIWETSAMMAAKPELVKFDEVQDGFPPIPFDYDILPAPAKKNEDTGVFWKASQSDPIKGQRILEATSQAIIQIVIKEFSNENKDDLNEKLN